jgi:hypothetical protein
MLKMLCCLMQKLGKEEQEADRVIEPALMFKRVLGAVYCSCSIKTGVAGSFPITLSESRELCW